jgi:hypothetical protein
MVGVGLTVMVATAVPEHPAVLDPVTVYDVFEVGEIINGLEVDPVDHE